MMRRWWPELALLAVVLPVYLASPIATPFDSRWSVYTAHSLIHEGNADLDEFRSRLKADGYYAIECIAERGARVYPLPGGQGDEDLRACPAGRLYNYYPVAVPMLAAPLVGALEGGLHLARPLLEPLIRATPPGYRRSLLEGDVVGGSMPLELVIASFITALAAVALYRLAREMAAWRVALGVALVFAFASPAWSTGSRALWQHTFSMLILPLGLHAILRRCPAWAGALFMLAFFVRPSNAIPLLLAGAWMLTLGRRETLRFIAGALPVAAIFVGINLWMYHQLLAPYFFVKRAHSTSLGLHAHFAEALVGHLLSPARGLLVYCPAFLFSFYGIWLWIRARETRRLGVFLGVGFLAHYLLISAFEEWFAGHSYGPRFFADLAPYLTLALAPAWLALGRLARGVGLATVVVGALIHAQGAWCGSCLDWNVKPVELHQNLARLWDWRDPPFLRGLR